MKTKYRSTLVLSLCILLLLLTACTPAIPPGIVKGRLLDAEGHPAADISLQLLEVTAQQGEELSLEASSNKADTEAQGEFTFEGVKAGKYVIIDLNITFALGGNTPSFAEMVIRAEDGTVLIMEVPESEGVDLGDLKMP